MEIYGANGVLSQKLLPAKENKTREIISRGRCEGPGRNLQPSKVQRVKCPRMGRSSGGSPLSCRPPPFPCAPRAASTPNPLAASSNNSHTIETSGELGRGVGAERRLWPRVVFYGSSGHRNGKGYYGKKGRPRVVVSADAHSSGSPWSWRRRATGRAQRWWLEEAAAVAAGV